MHGRGISEVDMSGKDSKEAFEAWAVRTGNFVGYELDECEDNSEYEYTETQTAWEAWKAAIEWAKKNMCNRN